MYTSSLIPTRLWDLDKDDNYVLALDKNAGFEAGENINCVAFSARKGKILLVYNGQIFKMMVTIPLH